MAIYQVNTECFKKIDRTTFVERGIQERADLQRLLKVQIEVLADDVMVLDEEFGQWEGSQRRIDLLALDQYANIVVIELKRTENGGHMELQAIRYAAMLSTMTLEQAVSAHSNYLVKNGIEGDAQERILSFLGWDEPDEDQFAQDVKIILASAEFSKELTSSVIWLNERNLDIKCIKMQPYVDGERTLLDVQQVIPLPETEEYQVKVREKQLKERQSRSGNRDFTKYDLVVNGKTYSDLAKRWLIFHAVSGVLNDGHAPQDLLGLIPWRQNMFVSYEGNLDSTDFIELLMREDTGGTVPRRKRFFCDEGELFLFEDRTYALTNQWGVRTLDVVEQIKDKYPSLGITVQPKK